MDGVYELQGNERIEVTREKVDCGESVKTSYYNPFSGILLRRDINIEVSEEFMEQYRLALQARTGA